MMRLTEIPPIPRVPKGLSKDLERFLFAVKQVIEIREGKAGTDADRFVRRYDLDSSMTTDRDRA